MFYMDTVVLLSGKIVKNDDPVILQDRFFNVIHFVFNVNTESGALCCF